MKMAISEAEFKNTFRKVMSSEFSDIPNDEDGIKFTFSKRFYKKMDKLVRSQRKVYYRFINTALKRVAVICVAFLTLLTVTFSVEAIREPVIKFIKQVYETFTNYSFSGDTTDKITKEYIMTWLPEGFEQTDTIKGDTIVTTVYENSLSEKIKFTQERTSNAKHSFDNENGEITTITVSDMKIDIYESENITHALWVKDGYYFKLSYYGNTDIDTIKAMIEAIE